MEILNKSFEDSIETKRNQPLGFLFVEPENLNFNMYRRKRRHQKRVNRHIHQKGKRQTGGFRSSYDFAFFGRDTVNQAAKVAQGVIKAATNDIDRIAKERINQVISQGGKEIESVLPKILRVAIEDVYQTPFTLLRNFGKQQFNKIRRKILR